MSRNEVIETLHACGFEARLSANMLSVLYGTRGSSISMTRARDTVRVKRANWWPGLNRYYQAVETLVKDEKLVSLTDMQKYLVEQQTLVLGMGQPSIDVAAAFQLYHAQRALFDQDTITEGLYTFVDCVRFAAMREQLPAMNTLVSMQVPLDVMDQICAGEQAAGIMVSLYGRQSDA